MGHLTLLQNLYRRTIFGKSDAANWTTQNYHPLFCQCYASSVTGRPLVCIHVTAFHFCHHENVCRPRRRRDGKVRQSVSMTQFAAPLFPKMVLLYSLYRRVIFPETDAANWTMSTWCHLWFDPFLCVSGDAISTVDTLHCYKRHAMKSMQRFKADEEMKTPILKMQRAKPKVPPPAYQFLRLTVSCFFRRLQLCNAACPDKTQ